MLNPETGAPRQFRLTELNRRASCRRVRWILGLLVLVVAFLVYLVPLVRTGKLEGTPRTPDGTAYDDFAVQLSKGNGFAVNSKDPDYARPYRKPGQADPEAAAAHQSQPSPGTSRPPLLPVVMAVSFKAFGC